MKKPLLIYIVLSVAFAKMAAAQYYYKDLVSNRLSLAEKDSLKLQKIHSVLIHSFEGDGSASDGFFCEKKISKDYRLMETFTKSNLTGKALLTSMYDAKGFLLQTNDSSEFSVSTSTYEYDKAYNIASIISTSQSKDDDFNTTLVEKHQYFYNDNGQPIKMFRIKNEKDTAVIEFIIDAKGNVTDEVETKPKGKHYYYYYDEDNRLTDIVKYHLIKNQLLPDMVFEYDSDGRVTKMLSVDEGVSGNYYTWQYVYNDGLRIIEKCFSKDKKLLGYFEYEYE